jgi:hypothetical protein
LWALGSYGMNNCKKCKAGTGGQHNSHLIKREKEKDVAAKKVLENIKGFLNINTIYDDVTCSSNI